jgi:2-polyprenyl-3-methyl-5-hydroxy-6-metoxy-1,4-benzoquinol methylase
MSNFNRGRNTKEYWDNKIMRDFVNEDPINYDMLDFLSYHKIACDIIRSNERYLTNKSLLEIGCADGKFIDLISSIMPNDWTFTGYDISDVGIQSAINKFSRENVTFLTKDILIDDIDLDYGFICIFETIEHLSELDNVRVLKGILEHCEYCILSTVNTKDNCFGEHISNYDFDSFEKMGLNVIWKQKLNKIDMSNIGDYGDYFYFIVLIKGQKE